MSNYEEILKGPEYVIRIVCDNPLRHSGKRARIVTYSRRGNEWARQVGSRGRRGQRDLKRMGVSLGDLADNTKALSELVRISPCKLCGAKFQIPPVRLVKTLNHVEAVGVPEISLRQLAVLASQC